MTPVTLLISMAGLSHREASDYLRVRLDTVQSWHRKTKPNQASEGVIGELKALIAAQENASNQFLDMVKTISAQHGVPDVIELGYPADDHEAQALGLPCVGAWMAMAGRCVARSPIRIKLVPRGSTLATAAAMDAHQR